jgi:phage terminase large subunit GpA-like protein
MLLGGRWVHRHPERHRHRSFAISGLYSPWMTWEELAREWIAAQGNNEELKVFVNTRLGETWEDRGERVSESALEARREDYPAEVPMRGAVLTMGVDVQGDRLEYAVKAWGAGEESWLLQYGVLWGDPAQAEVWRQLDLVIDRPWRHESGADLKVRSSPSTPAATTPTRCTATPALAAPGRVGDQGRG